MKIKLAFPLFILSLLFLSGCKTNQGIAESKEKDMAQLNVPVHIAIEVVDSSARILRQPNVGPQNNLTGYGYYIRISGDRVSAVLPCACSPSITNGFRSPDLILDNKTLENFAYLRNTDPRDFVLRFEVPNGNVKLYFELQVKPDKTVNMNLLRSGGVVVSGYLGKVKPTI